jgi:WD40 repeat protein
MSTSFDALLNKLTPDDLKALLKNRVSLRIDTRDWDEVRKMLSDPEFVQTKVCHIGLESMAIDFKKALTEITQEINKGQTSLEPTRELLHAFATAFHQEAHVFKEEPSRTAQQIYNNLFVRYGDNGDIGKALRRFSKLDEYPRGHVWLRRQNISKVTSTPQNLINTLQSSEQPIRALSLSPSGDILSGGDDGTLRFHKKDGSFTSLPAHLRGITALTTDGEYIISAGCDGFIRVFENQTNSRKHEWLAHGAKVSGLAVRWNDKVVVSCGEDRVLKGWDFTGSEKWQIHGNRLSCLCWDEKNKRLVSGSDDRTILIWDWDNEKERPSLVKTMRGHLDGVLCVAVSTCGKWGISGSNDKTTIVWDLANGEALHTLKGQRGAVRAIAVLPSPSGTSEYILTGSDDETIRIWDMASGAHLDTLYGHKGGVYSIAVDSDGKFTSGGQDGLLYSWSIGRDIREVESWQEHKTKVTYLAIKPDRQLVASGSADHSIRLWYMAEPCKNKAILRGHFGPITSLVFFNDKLVSGGEDGVLRLWSTNNGNRAGTIGKTLTKDASLPPRSPILCLVPLDENTLLSSHKDRFLRIWNLQEETVRELPVFHGVIRSLCFNRKLGVIVGSGTAPEISLWNLKSLHLPNQMEGHRDIVTCMVLMGEHHLVTGSLDKTIRIWSLETCNEESCFTPDRGTIRCLAVDYERGLIMAGGDDGSVLVWNRNSKNPIHILQGHAKSVRMLAYNASDGELYSSGEDQEIVLWNILKGEQLTRMHMGSVPTTLAMTGAKKICVGTQRGELAFFERANGKSESNPLPVRPLASDEMSLGVVSINTSLQMAIHVPSDIGSIKTGYHAPGGGIRTLYIVRDLYEVNEAQENIYKFCKQLIEEEGVYLIFSENGDQKLDSASIPADTMVSKGLLQLLNTFHSRISIFGVDRIDIIKESHKIAANLTGLKETRECIFEEIRKLLRKGHSRLPADMVNLCLYSHDQFYGYKDIALKEVLNTIKKSCAKLGLPLSAFPILERFHRVLQMENKINFKNAEEQRENLVMQVVHHLQGWYEEAQKRGEFNVEELQKLVPIWTKKTGQTRNEFTYAIKQRGITKVLWECQAWFMEWIIQGVLNARFTPPSNKMDHDQGEYLQNLLEIASQIGINPRALSDIQLYTDYLDSATNQMKPDVLMDELRMCILNLLDKSGMAQFSTIEEQAELSYNILRATIRPDMVGVEGLSPNCLDMLIKTLCEQVNEPFPQGFDQKIQALDQGILQGEKHYQNSLQRGQHMIQRTFDIMRQNNEETALLVCGGFHTDAVIHLLKNDPDTNWHVFTPKFNFDSIENTPGKGYFID